MSALPGRRRDPRANRRAQGKDSPRRQRTVDTDGHISRDWFRRTIWAPALRRAGITFNVRAHDLRHAHASWLQMGISVAAVADWLGDTPATVHSTYAHLMPDDTERGRKAMDVFFTADPAANALDMRAGEW